MEGRYSNNSYHSGVFSAVELLISHADQCHTLVISRTRVGVQDSKYSRPRRATKKTCPAVRCTTELLQHYISHIPDDGV